MDPIKIGSTVPAEKVHHIIERFPLKKQININYEDYHENFIYSFSLNKKKAEEEIALYNILSDFAQNIILGFYSKEVIEERVKNVSREILGLEKYDIINRIYEVLNDENSFKIEKELFKNELLNYLIENNILIIDGYLTFRPRTFNFLIDKAIGEILSDIQLEMEYDEFIHTLQEFVDNQYPKMGLLNVIIDGLEFQLLDARNNRIESEHIEELLRELFYDDINQSDILLSSLLAISPSDIVIHIKDGREEELISVLKRIFEGRIDICHGCNLCSRYILEKNVDKS